jgi:hypothetical protein
MKSDSLFGRLIAIFAAGLVILFFIFILIRVVSVLPLGYIKYADFM